MRKYARNYLGPHFHLEMKEKPSMERVAKALNLTLREKLVGEETVWYVDETTVSHVLAIAKWSLPYLTPKSKRAISAEMLLDAFKLGRFIGITPQEAERLWMTTTNQKYRWLKRHKPEIFAPAYGVSV